MPALIAAIFGAMGVWLLVGFLLFFCWIMDRHPWAFWVMVISVCGGLVGFGIYDDFIAAG